MWVLKIKIWRIIWEWSFWKKIKFENWNFGKLFENGCFENWNFWKLFENGSFENWNFEELFENGNFKEN